MRSITSFFLFLCLILISSKSDAQSDCTDQVVSADLNIILNASLSENFILVEQHSGSFGATTIFSLPVQLLSDFEYRIILQAPNGVKATGIEIRDVLGFQLEYIYKITEGDNDMITVDFTPDADGDYKVLFSVIPNSGPVCAYLAMLKRNAEEADDTGIKKGKKYPTEK